MKTILFLFLTAFCCILQSAAQDQNSLVGTWIEEGDMREVKIISPTHFIFYLENAKADTFMYAGMGTYSLEGGKYSETIQLANIPGYEKLKPVFEYKVEGDKFYQKGPLTMADGTIAEVNHVFTRVKEPKQNEWLVGMWKQLSFNMTTSEGKKITTDITNRNQINVVTPTYFIWVAQDIKGNTKKFSGAALGTYRIEGDKIYPVLEAASFPIKENNRSVMTYTLEGDKLKIDAVNNDGSWTEVLQKTPTKTTKVVSTAK